MLTFAFEGLDDREEIFSGMTGTSVADAEFMLPAFIALNNSVSQPERMLRMCRGRSIVAKVSLFSCALDGSSDVDVCSLVEAEMPRNSDTSNKASTGSGH